MPNADPSATSTRDVLRRRPRRRRNWLFVAPGVVFALVIVLGGLSQQLRGPGLTINVSTVIGWIVVLAFLSLLAGPLVWVWIYRDGIRLVKAIEAENPGISVVSVYSSERLEKALSVLSGAEQVGRSYPTDDFLALVVTDRFLELWRWRSSSPRKIVRILWSDVIDVQVGAVEYRASTDRALVLTVQQDSEAIEMPMPLEKRGRLRLIPLSDASFETYLQDARRHVKAN